MKIIKSERTEEGIIVEAMILKKVRKLKFKLSEKFDTIMAKLMAIEEVEEKDEKKRVKERAKMKLEKFADESVKQLNNLKDE